jgi:hypothetical protein
MKEVNNIEDEEVAEITEEVIEKVKETMDDNKVKNKKGDKANLNQCDYKTMLAGHNIKHIPIILHR